MKPSTSRHLSASLAIAPYSIGTKLKNLRAEKRLTLARLGAETGLSSALLSKLESERMVPTLTTLVKIAGVYGVDLPYFFSPVTHHSLAITRSEHITDPRRDQLAVKQTPLHHSTQRSSQVSKVVDIPAGVTFNVSESGARTELTACVLEGPLHMTAAGIGDVLRTGDCIVLNTDAVVMWTAPDNRCRVLAVFARTRPE